MTPDSSPSPDAKSSPKESAPICFLILSQFQIIIGIAKSIGVNIEGVTFNQVHNIIASQIMTIPAIVSIMKLKINHGALESDFFKIGVNGMLRTSGMTVAAATGKPKIVRMYAIAVFISSFQELGN